MEPSEAYPVPSYMDLKNRYPCNVCHEPTRIALKEHDPFNESRKFLVVCDNCFHSVWISEEFYETFIKEKRVV